MAGAVKQIIPPSPILMVEHTTPSPSFFYIFSPYINNFPVVPNLWHKFYIHHQEDNPSLDKYKNNLHL